MRWCARSQQSTSLLGLREIGCLQHLLRKKDTERADGEEHGQARCSLPFVPLHGHMQKGEKFSQRQSLTIVLACWFPRLGLPLLILQPLLVLVVLQHLWGQLLARGTRRQQQGVVAIVLLQHPQNLCMRGRETTPYMKTSVT